MAEISVNEVVGEGLALPESYLQSYFEAAVHLMDDRVVMTPLSVGPDCSRSRALYEGFFDLCEAYCVEVHRDL